MTFEQELMELVSHMDEQQRHDLLKMARQMTEQEHRLTALDLLKLSPEERNHRVAQSFAQASAENFEIFEAYSEEDVDGTD